MINQVSVIGLGALGILYADHIKQASSHIDLKVIASQDRINRYRGQGVYCNERLCDFDYVRPEDISEPSDLVIVAVKYGQLKEAIKDIQGYVGNNTTILSVLNGITSEAEISQAYPQAQVVHCVAQGMDAVKDDQGLRYTSKGVLCFGTFNPSDSSDSVDLVKDFFDSIDLPYVIEPHMAKKLWNKFMANVGINQVVALYEGNFGTLQEKGPARKMMIDAMDEVVSLSKLEEVNLDQSDIEGWLSIVDHINPKGMPSMRQDLLAKRYSELELFAGTVIAIAGKHNFEVPINQHLYKSITEIESTY